jgi:hypothetical protein
LAGEALTKASWKVLEARLHYDLEYGVELCAPDFNPTDERTWDIRRTAIEFCTLDAGTAATSDLAERVRLCEHDAQQELRHCLSLFKAELDEDAFRCAHTRKGISLIRYNWLVSDSRDIKRNRRDLLRTFPLVAPILCGEVEDIPHRARLLCDAVDSGQPFVQRAAELYHVSKSVLRSIAGKDSNVVGDCWAAQLPALLRLLSVIPPEKRPAREADWRNFNAACTAITELLKRPLMTELSMSMLSAFARAGFRVDTDELLNGENLDEWVSAIDEFFAALRAAFAFEASKQYAASQQSVSANQLMDGLIAASSLKSVHDMALRWRVARQRIYAAQVQAEKQHESAWTPILPGVFQANGFYIVELTTAEALKDEGSRMRNCVGDYGAACKEGRSRVFSVRSEDGSAASTFELRLSRGRAGAIRPMLVQHKGFHNARAPRACSEALSLFLAALRSEPLLSRVTAMYGSTTVTGSSHMDALRLLASIQALKETLTGRWAYHGLVRDLLPDHRVQ